MRAHVPLVHLEASHNARETSGGALAGIDKGLPGPKGPPTHQAPISYGGGLAARGLSLAPQLFAPHTPGDLKAAAV